VTVAGEVDDTTGMVLDLKDLKAVLESEVLQLMDHKFLNKEVPAFATKIPTTENIAVEIWNLLAAKLPSGRLHRIRLYETDDLFVDYYGD
jgi:6-pyruvoyltetrahydropterin/6-carboxytetrahydropterin synthase